MRKEANVNMETNMEMETNVDMQKNMDMEKNMIRCLTKWVFSSIVYYSFLFLLYKGYWTSVSL